MKGQAKLPRSPTAPHQRVLDFGLCALDFGSWALNFGFWVWGFGFWVRCRPGCSSGTLCLGALMGSFRSCATDQKHAVFNQDWTVSGPHAQQRNKSCPTLPTLATKFTVESSKSPKSPIHSFALIPTATTRP